jgi:hypothetical protein
LRALLASLVPPGRLRFGACDRARALALLLIAGRWRLAPARPLWSRAAQLIRKENHADGMARRFWGSDPSLPVWHWHARTHGVVKERKKPTRRPAASPSRLASAAGEVAGADEARIDGRLLSAVSWLVCSAHTGKRNPTT